MPSHRERELTFDVDDDFRLPSVEGLADQSMRTEHRTVQIASTYYDTDGRTLLAAGLTLRHREGAADAGWQLKVPTRSARTEISLPPSAGAEVPDRLLGLLTGVLRGQQVRPVAVIRTDRTRYRLFRDDRLVLEFADDRVHGTVLGERASITTWREIEAELGPAGDEATLQRATVLLRTAGATPAGVSSKLARTLGVDPPAVPTDALSAVSDYARRQWQVMLAGDVGLRRGLGSVHKTRVAVRRFRSMLRVLRPMLDGEHSAALDAELSWYQDLLGGVRDREVQRTRLAGRLAALPPVDVLGPVAGYIEQSLLSEQAKLRDELGRAVESARYLALLDQVAGWVADPPVAAGLDEEELQRLVRRAGRKARKRLAAALEVDDPAQLHAARKAAKRARYAAELGALAIGTKRKRQIRRLKHAQDVLGEYQDSIIAGELLRRLGTAPRATDGQNGFTLGLLYGIEKAAARDARAEAGRLEL